MTYRHIVLAGRYAPLCKVHFERIREELAGGKQVTILVTGADASRSSRLPWTVEERLDMCRVALAEFGECIDFSSEDDHPYDTDARQRATKEAMDQATAALRREISEQIEPPPVASLGWAVGTSVLYTRIDDLAGDEAKTRAAFFAGDDQALKDAIPETVFATLAVFRNADWFAGLAEEHRYIADYKKSWQAAPYAPIFVTVDMVIVHAGRVLLIQRGGQPGRGLWALPGGFLDGDEHLKDAALRELREETGLDLGWDDARLCLKGSHVFDDPERSARGRTITHAYHVELAAEETPAVTGSDDAAEAQWMPIEDLPSLRNQFFEDHGHILDYFLKR